MRFFQKTFLVADIIIEVVLGMPFLALSKVEINFAEQELNWRTYSLDKVLTTTKQVKIIDCKKFAVAALALDKKAFVVYIAYFGAKILIYLAREAQIALLLAEEVSVLKEYTDFLDVFFKELVAVLPERLDINEHIIDLEPGKQPSYTLINSLDLMKLKIFKTYIEINQANRFIQSSKSSV